MALSRFDVNSALSPDASAVNVHSNEQWALGVVLGKDICPTGHTLMKAGPFFAVGPGQTGSPVFIVLCVPDGDAGVVQSS